MGILCWERDPCVGFKEEQHQMEGEQAWEM